MSSWTIADAPETGTDDADPLQVDKTMDTPEIRTYTYHPLKNDPPEFRVLALHSSAEESDPIKCELLHLNLTTEPMKLISDRSPATVRIRQALRTLTALSYTWGDVENKRSIIVDEDSQINHPFSYWWIDAVCINQDDLDERNQQVALMTRIYKKASSIYVWLGEEADDSAMAMNLARQLSTVPTRGPGKPETQYPVLFPGKELLHRRALIAIFSRPWWERTWIRQEIAVTRAATIHCGDSVCPLYASTNTAAIMNRLKDQLGYDVFKHRFPNVPKSDVVAGLNTCFYLQPRLLSEMQSVCRAGKVFVELRDLINHTRTCKATDLWDKVFSILRLADPEVYKLAVKYRLSEKETFIAAVRSLILQERGVDLLSACQNLGRRHRLQCWVPDLEDDWKARPFKADKYWHRASYHDAGYTFEEEDSILKIRGNYIDTIEIIGERHCSRGRYCRITRCLVKKALSNPKIGLYDRTGPSQNQE
ncbi:hypothetical protein MMC18_001212 [Xylographa bjoerkii]|nr:hypothetical protein [Xylographa bjoerkii]